MHHHRIVFIIIIIGLVLTGSSYGQGKYFTHAMNNNIQSILITPDGVPLGNPVIQLGTQNLSLSFDDLDARKKDMYYRIILCNADWSKAGDIATSEYLKGFSENPILNSASSFNTNIPYLHYQLNLPNEDVSFKSSGNYAIEIYDLDQPDSVLAVACFSIDEAQVSIEGTVGTLVQNTTEGYNQFLNFNINHANYPFRNTDRDLKVFVVQNHRWDDVRQVSAPTYNKANQLIYDNEPQLYFQGGNEFRRFDITDKKIAGMHVANIEYMEGFNHFDLYPDQVLFGRNSYTYSPDNDGRVYYQLEDNSNYTTESDYCFVHFSLAMKDPYLRGGVYLSGDITQGFTPAQTKMIYNFDHGCYEKTLLLKQGLFEYQYLYAPVGTTSFSSEKTEGNYWQTENAYSVYVYYRPIGSRHDLLIGYKEIKSNITK